MRPGRYPAVPRPPPLIESSTASTPSATRPPDSVAAVDLGSNSFHMVIGQARHGAIAIVDRLREPVRLAAGLREDGTLDEETVERALDCLGRFGQRLRAVPLTRVRAVGTNTLRKARTAGDFLSRARKTLGVPIEILPGAEEARLVYLGVAHDLSDDQGPRLVVDIGGGSTECVLGEQFEARLTASLQMGCVSYSQRFFPDGELSREAFKAAGLAARLELKGVRRSFRSQGWANCVGSSGTIKAIGEILKAEGWTDGDITAEGLKRLRKATARARSVRRLTLAGLSAERAAVLPGGIAVLEAVFDSLRIERMRVSQFALREGLLYDILGRIEHEDVRDRTIRTMALRYHVDQAQAARVQRSALQLFDDVADQLGLDREVDRQILSWAAALHEIGLTVGYSGYQKHGAYLLAHSDMPGFSREDQNLLACLVRLHRRKLDRLTLDLLPPFHRERARRLVALLRLAVLLNRGRSPRGADRLHLRARADEAVLRLELPLGWRDEHPLTHADLESERSRFEALGLPLEFVQ